MIPDNDLMLRIRDGDVRAYETLFERHREAVRRRLRRIVRSEADAEDLLVGMAP